MICAKCQQGIKSGEEYDTITVHSASAAGATIHRHYVCPPKPRRS
ncbi:hypothetical protein ACFVY1_34990 [Streptomyces sp. NPDC058293]